MKNKKEFKKLVRKARKLDKEFMNSDFNIRLALNTEFLTMLEEDSKKYTTYSYFPYGVDLRDFKAHSVMKQTTKYTTVKTEGNELIDNLLSFFVEEKESDIDFLSEVNLSDLLRQEQKTKAVSDDE